MSCPDFINCDYPLPNPEAQEINGWDCNELGGNIGELFNLTKEGRICDAQMRDLNYHGKFRFYAKSKSGEFFLYLAHFVNGQLQQIERPDLIKFESALQKPKNFAENFFCEHIGPNSGVVFFITKAGRLVNTNKIERELSADVGIIADMPDLNFSGELKFYNDLRWMVNRYTAHFENGQLLWIDKIIINGHYENKQYLMTESLERTEFKAEK